MADGDARFILGTDNQGGTCCPRCSTAPVRRSPSAEAPFCVAATLGVFLGLIAGYFGGKVDALIMRVGDVILSFPTILLALLVSGIARAVFPAAG